MIRRTLAVLSGLAVVFFALVWLSYRRDMRAARARLSSGSTVVNTPCGLIEYADVGTGPVILTIHGAGGGFDQSLDIAKHFLPTNFRIVAPSRFGYLRTPLPSDASSEMQADAHACLLDALKVQRVLVVGGSMGAPSAMQFCLRHPDRCSALVLLFPIAYSPRPASEPQQHPSAFAQFLMNTTLRSDFVLWTASKLTRNIVMKTILATPPTVFNNATPDEQDRVLEVLRNIEPISQRAKGLRNDATIAPSVPRYDLEHIAAPTLVISAEDDLFGTFKSGRYTAEHIPGARFVGYPTGGHLLVGRVADVRRELAEFLRLHAAAPTPQE